MPVKKVSASTMTAMAHSLAGKIPPVAVDSKPTKPKLPVLPRHLTKKAVEAINSIEHALQICKIDRAWPDVWDAYCESAGFGMGGVKINPNFMIDRINDKTLRRYLIESLERLDSAFADIRNYRPVDHLTQGTASLAGAHFKKGVLNDGHSKALKLLKDLKYLQAPRGNVKTKGTQGWIREYVAGKTDQSERSVRSIIKELKGKLSGS